MKKSEKILIFVIFLGLASLIIGGWFVFKDQFNTDAGKKSFDIYGKIDYAKYARHNLNRESVDVLFEKIREMDKKIKNKPDDPTLIIQLAGFEKMLYEYDAALADYNKIIASRQDFGPVYAEVADLYVYPLARYGEAMEYYQKAIQFASYRPDYYRSLADLYISKFPEKMGEIEKLMLNGAEANKEDKNRQIDFYSYLISFFQRQGDLPKAIAYAKKCLEIKPDEEIFKTALKDLEAELSAIKK